MLYIHTFIYIHLYTYIYMFNTLYHMYIYIRVNICRHISTYLKAEVEKRRLSWKCLSGVSYVSRSHVIYFQPAATIRGFVWHDLCWWSDPGVPWWRSRPRQSHVYGSGLRGLLYSFCMSFLICRWRYLTVRFDENLQLHLFDGQLVAMLS